MQATNVGAVGGRDELASAVEYSAEDGPAAVNPDHLGRSTRDILTN